MTTDTAKRSVLALRELAEVLEDRDPTDDDVRRFNAALSRRDGPDHERVLEMVLEDPESPCWLASCPRRQGAGRSR